MAGPIKTREGYIIVAGDANPGSAIHISRDNGQSWQTESEITIWDNQGQGILTMPAVVALPDGSAYAVYGFKGQVLMGARFNPNVEG